MDFMTTKTIEISGQRISVNPLTDYQTILLSEMVEGDKLVVDRHKHADYLALLVEVIAPALPKKLYKKVDRDYWWLGTAAEFAEIWVQLDKICRETFPQYFEGSTNSADKIVELTPGPQPEPTVEELIAELDMLKKLIITQENGTNR